jgi:hypothetical protein
MNKIKSFFFLFRFTADVTCLDTDESGALLAAGSADMTIKVVK